MLLLDTCTLLMLGGNQKELSPKAVSALEKYGDNYYISTISSFEIVLKHKLGKLGLPSPPREWYQKAIELYGIEEIQVTSQIAMDSAELPFIHKDPCDRIIIATARSNKLKIVTPDKIIPQYPQTKVIW